MNDSQDQHLHYRRCAGPDRALVLSTVSGMALAAVDGCGPRPGGDHSFEFPEHGRPKFDRSFDAVRGYLAGGYKTVEIRAFVRRDADELAHLMDAEPPVARGLEQELCFVFCWRIQPIVYRRARFRRPLAFLGFFRQRLVVEVIV